MEGEKEKSFFDGASEDVSVVSRNKEQMKQVNIEVHVLLCFVLLCGLRSYCSELNSVDSSDKT